MASDKFSAVWVSHSSIGDFLKCPQAYFLNNIYRNPESGNKVSIMQPPLALGQAVHEVLESLSVLPTKDRFTTPLVELFEQSWDKVSGKKGGFFEKDTEARYKQRGLEMINRVRNNPGPLARKAVKIREDLPHYWLSDADNIILCGKIDWLEYLEDEDKVNILDFKTGMKREDPESLQLPIYHLLVTNCQGRQVAKASYWYLVESDEPEEVDLPDLKEAHEKVLSIAKRIKLARQFKKFDCPQGESCWACRDLLAVSKGEAEHVGINDFGQDLFILKKEVKEIDTQSDIL